MPDGYEKRTRSQVRNQTNKLVSKLKNSSPPVQLKEIVQIIRSDYGFRFIVKSNTFSDSVSGVYTRCDRVVGIMYNSNHSRNRQRFTVAHEIGHLVLGHRFVESEHKEINDFEIDDPIEVEANTFASELLMPFDWVRKDLKRGLSWKELAKLYEVSELAVGWRISQSDVLLQS